MLLRTIPMLNDFKHKIIALKEPGSLAPQFISTGIEIKTIYYAGLFDIPGILRLRKLIQKENPDIIITYLFHADMLGRLALRTITNAPIIPSLRTTYNHPKYLIARVIEWLTKPLVNQYLANSEAVKQFYIDHIGVNGEKITVIPNGIDIEYFNSLVPDPNLRTSLSIQPNDFVIICVANLHINKGHTYLLEAFEQLSASISPARGEMSRQSETEGWEQKGELKRGLKLLIIGDGEEKRNLLNQIKDYTSKENIHFLGRRSDVPQLLKISNLFILPTLFEGQSNAIMEAMAVGLPIITTDIPENRILVRDKETGYLIQTRSSESIKETLLEIFNNRDVANEKGRVAKESIEKSFSLEKSVESLKIFLHSL